MVHTVFVWKIGNSPQGACDKVGVGMGHVVLERGLR